MYRKTSSTYAHSYKILLFDSQNSAFSLRYILAASTKHSPRIRMPRYFPFAVYIASYTFKDECLLLYIIEKEGNIFISYHLYARVTTEWETILLLQLLRYAILLEAAIDRNHKRSPPIHSFCLARVKTFLHNNT